MNAVMSLCHFCENHGPCVVFSTQTYQGLDCSTECNFYGLETQLQDIISNKERNQDKLLCEACQASGGYISNDHNDKVTYLSSHLPMEDNVAKLVKHAAVRSLSCELVPGKEGEMYFGDERRGHVLSHTFFLQDSRARGFQRWFSIVVFMRDKHYLLHSWQFIQAQLDQLVNQLQARAAKVCAEEQKNGCARAARLADPGSSISVARPITSLTDTPHLYAQIHLWFSWLLSAGSKRLQQSPATPLDMPTDFITSSRTENGFLVIEKPAAPSAGNLWPVVHDAVTIRHIRALLAHLGQTKLTVLLYSVVTGRNLIVRGPQRLVQFLFHLLKLFLPVDKHKGFEYCEDYKASAIIQGLPINTAVPVVSASLERLDIVPLSTTGESDGGLELEQYQYLAKTGIDVPCRVPEVVTRAITYIADVQLSDDLACSMIKTLITKWTQTSELVREARVHAVGQDLTQLLLSLGAHDYDSALLRYWAAT